MLWFSLPRRVVCFTARRVVGALPGIGFFQDCDLVIETWP